MHSPPKLHSNRIQQLLQDHCRAVHPRVLWGNEGCLWICDGGYFQGYLNGDLAQTQNKYKDDFERFGYNPELDFIFAGRQLATTPNQSEAVKTVSIKS